MKSYRQTQLAVITLFATLAMPVGLGAQQDDAAQAKKAQHHHYKLIDVGTFGGPQSYLPESLPVPHRILDNHEVLTGGADTSLPDPFPNSCFNSDCFVSHGFRRDESGELADLGVIPGTALCTSAATRRADCIR